MKRHLLFSLAAALFCSAPLVLSAKSANPSDAAAEPVRLRIDVDRGVLPADSSETAIVKVGLDCIRPAQRGTRPPINLAIVIDRSGSMSGEKISRAREAALEAVHRLAADDIVSIVAYDTNVQTLVHAQRVGDGRRIEEAICSIEADGSTALYGGVSQGAAEVRRHLEDGRYVNRVILLSDGLANVGPSTPEELGRLGASLMKEGISVTTIGLGLGFNEDLMTRLAQRSDGNTYFVEDSADLPRIFSAELGDVLSVVARRVVIEIEFPEGVRPRGFVGRDGVIRGQKAELTLNQLYGGQEKFALVEVEVAPSKAGAEREIARAKVNYEDALNGRSATLTANRRVQFSARKSAVVASADAKVQADYAANVMAVAKSEAIALVDENRREEAAARLRERSEDLRKMGEEYRNSAVTALAAKAAPAAAAIEVNGLDNASRKALRADSAQTINQQATSSPTSGSQP
jgi:Ca-activated chloride channel family protein